MKLNKKEIANVAYHRVLKKQYKKIIWMMAGSILVIVLATLVNHNLGVFMAISGAGLYFMGMMKIDKDHQKLATELYAQAKAEGIIVE